MGRLQPVPFTSIMEFIVTITQNWFIYIIEAENGFLYTGITTDLERRLKQHSGEIAGRGAKFFNRSPPKRMRFSLGGLDHSLALKIEGAIKKLKRQQKDQLLESNYDIEQLKLLLRI